MQIVAPLRPFGEVRLSALRTEERAAVVPVRHRKLDAKLNVALERDRRYPRQHVDLSALQSGEALRGRQRREPDFRCVSQNGGGNRATDINVQAAPVPLRIGG